MTDQQTEEILRSAYRAFNARDVDVALELMHADVYWPNAWEGGRVVGRVAVGDYWRRQFESISSQVEPEAFDHLANGEVSVLVNQTVHDAKSGEKLSEDTVRHRYRLKDGLIVWMDVEEAAASQSAGT